MSDSIFFAPFRVPVTDPRTGLMSREWYLFFQALFNRVGGDNAASISDLQQSIPLQESSIDALAVQAAALQDLGQSPPVLPADAAFNDFLTEMRETRELLAEVLKTLQDIRQGGVVL